MALINRSDRGGLAAPVSAKIFEGRVGRTHGPGDPLYYGPDDLEYRDQSEVERIAAQLPGLKFTLLHPEGMLKDGSPAKIVGHVIEGRVDGNHAVARILITDDAALAAIEDGMHELSLGYSAKLDGDRYQREITLDHLALVPRARCGASCALRVDSMGESVGECTCPTVKVEVEVKQCACESEAEVEAPEAEMPGMDSACPCKNRAMLYTLPQMTVASANTNEDLGKNQAKEFVMDELKAQLSAALADAAAQKARADQAEADAAEQKIRADLAESNARADAASLQTQVDAEKARADAADLAAQAAVEKARADADAAEVAKFDAAVTARVDALTSACAVLGHLDDEGKPVDRSKMSNRDIKIAIIKHVDGDDMIAEDAVEAFVDGMYTGALKRHAQAAGSRADARQAIVQLRSDGAAAVNTTGASAEKAARDAMILRASTAWMTPSKKDQE
jgi:hypothetical protein